MSPASNHYTITSKKVKTVPEYIKEIKILLEELEYIYNTSLSSEDINNCNSEIEITE
jgi:hypothetical protein